MTTSDYKALHRSYVIFICTFDPFHAWRYVYTFENRCCEDTSIVLGDEATKIILNTKGSEGEISQDLKDLLRFMGGHAPESRYAKALNDAVADIRKDEKWRREFMVLVERDRANQRLGERRRCVSIVRHSKNTEDSQILSRILMIQPNTLQEILSAIEKHPEWDDEQAAEHVEFD